MLRERPVLILFLLLVLMTQVFAVVWRGYETPIDDLTSQINLIACFVGDGISPQATCNYVQEHMEPPFPNSTIDYNISVENTPRTDFLIGYKFTNIPRGKFFCPINILADENEIIQLLSPDQNNICMNVLRVEKMRSDVYYDMLGVWGAILVKENTTIVIEFDKHSTVGYGYDSFQKKNVIYGCINQSNWETSPENGTRIMIFEKITNPEAIYALLTKKHNLSSCYTQGIITSKDIENLQLKIIGNASQIGEYDITEFEGNIYLKDVISAPLNILYISDGQNFGEALHPAYYDSLNNRYNFKTTVKFKRQPWYYPFDDASDKIYFNNTQIERKEESIPKINSEDSFDYSGIWEGNRLTIIKTRSTIGKILGIAFNCGVVFALLILLKIKRQIEAIKKELGAPVLAVAILIGGFWTSYVKIESIIFWIAVLLALVIYVVITKQNKTAGS